MREVIEWGLLVAMLVALLVGMVLVGRAARKLSRSHDEWTDGRRDEPGT